MKNVTLIRHGKATQDFGFIDFDRPLIQAGIENSRLVAKKLPENYFNEAIIWSSASKRASETAITFANCLNYDLNLINFEIELYTFDSIELEKIIKFTSNSIQNLIIFGHNSAITDFVNKFGDIYIENVPTSGLVSINFQTDNWKSITNGKTIQTIFPSQIH